MKGQKLKEIRIYFESLEQGNHFVKPYIQEILSNNSSEIPIKLVQLKKTYQYYSKNIYPILFWKDPDVLITCVFDNEEYPIILIEFSRAAFTKDHELQRFDGYVAAAKNDCIFVKISPSKKKSPSGHGGDISFDHNNLLKVIYEKFNKYAFHFEWPVNEDGTIVEINPDFLACPPNISGFKLLLKLLIENFIKQGYLENWDTLMFENYNEDWFIDWKEKVNASILENITNMHSSRTNYVDGFLELKFNRFGHAMDPERGMLAYYGTITEVISLIGIDIANSTWYKSIPKENAIVEYIRTNGINSSVDLLFIFKTAFNIEAEVDEFYESEDIINNELDISDLINKYYINLSKPLRTILYFSNAFCLKTNQIELRLIWNQFEKTLISTNVNVTPIKKINEFSEDLVTYICAHNVYKSNNYVLIGISYPGDQGDRVILIEPGTGRAQQRKYVDILATSEHFETVNIQENKGKYSKGNIKKDIVEVYKYKTDNNYVEGLNDFLEIFSPKSKDYTRKVGVGFWASPKFNISNLKDIGLDKLDFFICIANDLRNWKVWHCGDNFFENHNGQVKLVEIYTID